MLQQVTGAVAVVLACASVPVLAQATPEYFKSLEFLVGHCWTSPFPDGKATDTHCFEWMYGREFIRDRHIVRSAGPDYRGETVYYLDGATKSVKYRYWNTDGGLSDGSLQVDGKLIRTPEEVYRGKNGLVQKFSSDIEPLSDTRYRVSTRSWNGESWQDAWSMIFRRTDAPSEEEQPRAADALKAAIQQLRDTRGHWDVTTAYLKPDGSVAKSVTGTYDFDWLVEDRVLRGQSRIPELASTSGLLFYVNARKAQIEMASVGQDGHLWVMTGPAGGETRTTPNTPMADGSTLKLRFTRFNISDQRFESKMESSTDGGATWVPGNHQVFVRRR